MRPLILAPIFCLPLLPVLDSPGAGTASSEAPAPRRVQCKVDPVHSSMFFKIKHAGAAWFYGRFNRIEGEFTIDADRPEDSSVEIRIAADSIDTHAEQRDRHLRSPDFFDAKQFPEIVFKSEKVTAKGDDRLEIEGELEMRGVKKPLTLTAVKVGEGEFRGKRIGYETTFSIRRSDFGVNYGLQGGVLGDEVQVTISVEGMVQED